MLLDTIVLNLIINGLPSKPQGTLQTVIEDLVLNLIINGLPSKLELWDFDNYNI